METTTATPTRQLRKFGAHVVLWMTLAGAILVVISGLMFRSITQLMSSESWVAHSYQILDTLDLTEAFFTDAQSAERGYVATCKPSLISPFRRDLPQIFGMLATLRGLTTDNAVQHDRVESLNRTMTAELERMSSVITTNLDGHQVQAETMITDQQNVDGTRAVSSLLNAMETDERALLAQRLHNVTTLAWVTLISCAVGVALIFAILGFLFWLIRREGRRRERTEGSLQQSNQKLEDSLQELHRYNSAARAAGLLGELLQTCRSAEEALSIAARHLGEMLPGAAGAIALFDAAHANVDVVRSIGDGVLFSPSFRADDCWSLRRGRPHQAGPGGFEPYCNHVAAQGHYVFCVPLIAQGETLGVVTVARDSELAGFERQTVQTATEQLSLALANLKLQENLRSQSLRDPLTGLFNRRYMDEALAQEITRAGRQNTPLSIAMVDIDHFKRFNDAHGHEGGDVLLTAFGQFLGAHARSDDIVCRYGGEEFALILPGADLQSAAVRLDEIRLAAKKLQVQSNGRVLGPVSLSAGLAVYPRDGASGEAVMAAADAALYEAKRGGRDRVVLAHPAMHIAEAG